MPQTDSSGPSFDGTVVVTGATGGLGRALLDPLARRRPEHLVLLGRSAAAMRRAADDARAPGARFVSTVAVDLSDLGSVALAGAEVHRLTGNTGSRVRGLLMVAGVQHADRKQVSAQGVESTFAVNVAAQHLLLRTIEPAFARESHAVLVSAGRTSGTGTPTGWCPRPDGPIRPCRRPRARPAPTTATPARVRTPPASSMWCISRTPGPPEARPTSA